MDYISTVQASKIWKISSTRITILAKRGRIAGAIQIGSRWMIPKNTQKPLDARTKPVKAHKEEGDFRFPNFAGISENLFSPALTEEELEIKKISEAIYSCNFNDAENLLSNLPEKASNIYIQIATLHLKCMANLMLNKNDLFFDAYGQLTSIFQKDFPYKKEMSVFLNELNATLGLSSYFYNEFEIDVNYNYHNSFYSHFITLPFLSLFYFDTKKLTARDLNLYEINSKLVDSFNNPIDSQTIHLYLGFANDTIGQKEKSVFHYRKALEIAEKYNFLWLPAVQYYYVGASFEPALKYFSKEFVSRLQLTSDYIHTHYTTFINSISKNNIFNVISKKKYLYIVYAVKGYSNKEVANLLNISEKNVSKNYCSIYELFNVTNKKELVDYYLESIMSNN